MQQDFSNMNFESNDFQEWSEMDCDTVDFNELESKLEAELEEQMSELKDLEIEREKIGNPDTIGETMMNVVWEQFINQIGVQAGEDFIKENGGLKLDLRDSAHIQTTENFEKGKIATHNTKIDYQQRYNDWQSNFVKDENGNVKTKYDPVDKVFKPVLKDGYRKPYDDGRPKGSAAVHMDETISVAEQVRDAAANAHLTEPERVAFDQSPINLNPMDARANSSKNDHDAENWLNHERNGKKPADRFDIDEQQIREKDKLAREEFERLKKEGEKKSVETGKQSRMEEAKRVGGKALRAFFIGLLASLMKDIIRKLIAWFRAGNRKLETFIDSIIEAVGSFFLNLKERVVTGIDNVITAIATSIFGPVIGMIKKAWIYLKQGYKSVKEAIDFLKNPENKNKPFSLKMMEVGKIVVVGITAGGSILLGELITAELMMFPPFAIEIPYLGSIASLLGVFLGGLVSGLIGALALNKIDRMISEYLKKENTEQIIDKGNTTIALQTQLIGVLEKKLENTCTNTASNIKGRHGNAAIAMRQAIENISNNSNEMNKTDVVKGDLPENQQSDNDNKLNQIHNLLN